MKKQEDKPWVPLNQKHLSQKIEGEVKVENLITLRNQKDDQSLEKKLLVSIIQVGPLQKGVSKVQGEQEKE